MLFFYPSAKFVMKLKVIGLYDGNTGAKQKLIEGTPNKRETRLNFAREQSENFEENSSSMDDPHLSLVTT